MTRNPRSHPDRRPTRLTPELFPPRAATNVILAAAFVALSLHARPLAQDHSTVAYAIEGARIVTLAGPIIEAGTLVVRDGKIAAVGANVAVPQGATRIDGRGLHVYPGLFDAVTQLGLTEVGQGARGTVDTNEVGAYNPQLVAASAVHPSSELIPVARETGLTHVVAVPGLSASPTSSSGTIVIAGQASAIHLAGWSIEEMQLQPSVGVVVNWPRLVTTSFDFTTFSQRQRPFNDVKQEYDKRLTELGQWIERTRRYLLARNKAAASTDRDLKLDALGRVVSGELPLLVIANEKRQIRDAVTFASEHKLRMVLLGGTQAAAVTDLLREHAVPVILNPPQTVPDTEDSPYDAPYALAGELTRAGLKVSISTFNASDSRTLPYEAGTAVAYGLSWEDGLKAITLNPAQALGIADRVGTLEPGKLANLIVTTGDPLEITTVVKHLFINGQPTSLDNKHLRSYEHWRRRPRPTTSTK
jgi:imidazolonepropionase-like amidohydrolase